MAGLAVVFLKSVSSVGAASTAMSSAGPTSAAALAAAAAACARTPRQALSRQAPGGGRAMRWRSGPEPLTLASASVRTGLSDSLQSSLDATSMPLTSDVLCWPSRPRMQAALTRPRGHTNMPPMATGSECIWNIALPTTGACATLEE